MSKLYASITSDMSKTEATRRASKELVTHTRGWDDGVEVIILDGKVTIWRTGGSNGAHVAEFIASWKLNDRSTPVSK